MKRFVALLMTVMLLLSSACAESATATLQELYAQAELLMVQGDYMGAAAKFEALGAYADASQMAMYCKAIAAAEMLGLYSMAVDAFNDLGDFKDSKQMAKYYEGRMYEAGGTIDVATASDAALDEALWATGEAEKIYAGLAFFKDSLTRYAACGERIKEIKKEQNRRAADQQEATYQKALMLEENGDYAEAIKLYQNIKGYKDSAERIQICQTAILDGKYDAAVALMNAGKYSEAITAFNAIKTHRDSAEKIKECETAILDGKYEDAMVLLSEGQYGEAYDAFIVLDGYKDSEQQANSVYEKAKADKLAKAKIGSYVLFGTYEQDNDTSNGKEDIEWLVLAKEGNRLLVLSRYALDCKPFHSKYTQTSWRSSSLRSWLNTTFYNAAFSNLEKAYIPTVMVPEDKTSSGRSSGSSQDKVFALSVTEVQEYFDSERANRCTVTAYVKAMGIYTENYVDGPACYWWLRTPADQSGVSAASVMPSGKVYASWGNPVIDDEVAVRPAMWIDLTSDADHNATPTPAATNTPAPKMVVITSDSAKIRTEASISAGLVKTAYKGESFTLLGESGDFYQISVNGKTGYIHKGVCKIQ